MSNLDRRPNQAPPSAKAILRVQGSLSPGRTNPAAGTIVLLGLAVLTAVAGCAPRYKVTLTNGNVMTTRGKPKLDPEQGVYRFKDTQGKPGYLPQLKIKEIEPL